jgi:CelD/BcsL family acetyltransferase involved in cellulose biosynthesis
VPIVVETLEEEGSMEKPMRLVGYDEFMSIGFATAWRELLRTCKRYDMCSTYEWNSQWWRSFGRAGGGSKKLFLLVQENNAGFRSIVPLMIVRRGTIRVVELIGQSGGLSINSDVIAPTAEKESVFASTIEYLCNHPSEWDVLSLVVPEWTDSLSPFVRAVLALERSQRMNWSTDVTGYSGSIHLPKSFDEYLSSMGGRTRRNLKHYLRSAADVGASLSIYRRNEISERLPLLFELNATNWDTFKNCRNRQFMISLVDELAKMGDEGAVFGVLTAMGRPCAAFFGFQAGDAWFAHTAGVQRENVAGLSPGTTMWGLLIRKIIEWGGSILDVGPGLSEYKIRLGARVEPKHRLLLWRSSFGYSQLRAIEWARKSLGLPFTRKIKKMIAGWAE